MPVKASAAMASGNQPPSTTLSRLAEKKVRSMTTKNAVAATASQRLRCQVWRTTKKVSSVVMSMVPVTAMP